MKNTVITFEDKGQDFLTWTIDPDGNLLDCRPFQLSVWREWIVTNTHSLKIGGPVEIRRRSKPHEELTINYKAENIELIENDYRQCVNCQAVVRDSEMKKLETDNGVATVTFSVCPDCDHDSFYQTVKEFEF